MHVGVHLRPVRIPGVDDRFATPAPGANVEHCRQQRFSRRADGLARLEDLAALAFVVAIQRERGVRAITAPLLTLFAVALVLTAIAAFTSSAFLDVYRVHSACFGVLLALGAFAGTCMRGRRIGAQLLTGSLAVLALDYLHVPLLSLVGVKFPTTYLGLESYVTMVLDIALGVAILVHLTDGARVELESATPRSRTPSARCARRRTPTRCAACPTAPRSWRASQRPRWPARSRWWTSTTSRRSTTASATPRATSRSRP